MPQNKLLYFATFSVGLLMIGLLAVSFKLYDFSLKNKELKDKIKLEKSIHQNQISEILKRYDSVNNDYVDKNADTKKPVENSNGVLPAKQNVSSETKPSHKKKISTVNISALGSFNLR